MHCGRRYKDLLLPVVDRDALHRLDRNGNWDGRLHLRQVQVGCACISLIVAGVGAARYDVFLCERVGNLSLLESHLVAAPHGCLALAEPGDLPGEADSGSKILVVIPIPRNIRVWRVLPDKLRYGQTCADSRFHPSIETSSGDSEDRIWAIGWKRHQTVCLVRYAVAFPTQP